MPECASCRPALGRAGLALAAVLLLDACAGGPAPIPGPETTTSDINTDIRATMPVGQDQSRPALPGAPLPTFSVDPHSSR
jgi:hypothetical protein